MNKYKIGRIERDNISAANVVCCRGEMSDIGALLCSQGEPTNFVITGNAEPRNKYDILTTFIKAFIGKYPIIVLHGNDYNLERFTVQEYKYNSELNPESLWIINNQNSQSFEPFYGMTDDQIVSTIRQLAKKLEYSVTPRLERITKAHIAILDELKIPVSLSGFYYLCKFDDMGEFHNNIMELSCGTEKAQRIWVDLDAENSDGNSQFDLFRTVIGNLANEARENGWDDDNDVADCNCMEAISKNATMLLSVNNMYTELLMPYFSNELKTSKKKFILIFDNITITDEDFLKYIKNTQAGCYCGIVTQNITESLNCEEGEFQRILERMDYIVINKHSTGGIAEVLSNVIGMYEHTQVELSRGSNKEYFKLLPQGSHNDVRISTASRHRVMPGDITSLRPNQAIIFDTRNNKIIYYN